MPVRRLTQRKPEKQASAFGGPVPVNPAPAPKCAICGERCCGAWLHTQGRNVHGKCYAEQVKAERAKQ